MIVLGLDLSLTSTGIVVVPADWGLEWSRIRVYSAGSKLSKDAPERERMARLHQVMIRVFDVAKEHNAGRVVVEQYAFSARASQAHALGELGGVVKHALWRMGLVLAVVAPASARKLLGKQPRKDVKVWAAARLYAAGAPKTWTLDQCDAFIAANYYLSEHGGDAIVMTEAT